MKNLEYALVFIFCTVCTIIGLCLSKFYTNFIKNNILIRIILYLFGFLLVLKLILIMIVPLFTDIFSYINMAQFTNVFDTFILPALKSPVLVISILALMLFSIIDVELVDKNKN